MSVNGNRPPAAAERDYHNTHPVSLQTLFAAAAPPPLTRRELCVVRAKYRQWREDLAARIVRRIEADPLAPIASDQRVLRHVDGLIDGLDRAFAALTPATTALRRRLGITQPDDGAGTNCEWLLDDDAPPAAPAWEVAFFSVNGDPL